MDAVRREAENVTAQYARLARIPGFRPGHAPATLVRRRFAENIRSEVLQSLLPKFFENAVREQKFSVVGRPQFEDVKFEDDQPLTCKATFEIVPDFEIQEYKGLAVEEDAAEVSEAAVDQALEELRERAATFEVVEGRPAVEGDHVLVHYQGRDPDSPALAGSAEKPLVESRDALVHLGGPGTVSAFTENLVGSQAGEVREFQVRYPEDHPQKSLAGRPLNFRVEVLGIKKKVVPPVNDDLAKSVSELATLEELRAKLRRELGERRAREAEADAKKKLLSQLLEAYPVAVPEVLVEVQMDRKLERVLAQLIAQGIDPRTAAVDWRKVREDARPDAEREVRASLILEKIANLEKIEVSEEEVDELVREIARERREPPATVKTRLTQEGEIARLKSTRRSQKALELIYRHAKIIRKNETGPSPAAAGPPRAQ